jgi:hypothetical protein
MSRFTKILVLLLLCNTFTYSQIKIGDDVSTIDDASILELESTSKVLVLTRMTNEQMLGLAPLPGGMVFNTDTNCIHSYNGTNWISLCNDGIDIEVAQQQSVITASEGQTEFTTPVAIDDSDKIEVYRNGVRIDFTTVDTNTIRLESEITCYQNDRIRIVQIL